MATTLRLLIVKDHDTVYENIDSSSLHQSFCLWTINKRNPRSSRCFPIPQDTGIGHMSSLNIRGFKTELFKSHTKFL